MPKLLFLTITNFWVLYLIIFFLPIIICPQQALGVINILEISSEDMSTEPTTWNLQADKLTTFANNTIIEAEGNIVLTKDGDTFKADFARYYYNTNWLFLKGNVVVKMGQDTINAEEAEFNLITKTGWINNGNIFISSSHIYFSGAHIIKHWGNQYTFNNATLTTCDGSTPAWSISAKEATVELDGYAQLVDPTFKIRNVDMLSSPFFTLPTKKARQSGLLAPNYGISVKRGLYYTQPYFLAIDESNDLTLYGGLMAKIGPLVSARFRSHPFKDQKTWFAITGIYDKNNVTEPGKDLVYPSSQLVRNNYKRYWIRGMADGFIGVSTWRYISNIDYVSDQDYLKEFDQNTTGFSKSRNELFRMFGRDLHEYDQHRLNSLLIRNDWQRIGIAGSLRYEQNPKLGHGNRPHSESELIQRLPQLDGFLYQGKIFQPFFLEGEAHLQSTYMYRAEGSRGWRTELFPKVVFPFDLKYGYVIGTVGFRETYYLTDVKSHTSPFAPYVSKTKTPRQTGQHRNLININIESYTQANHIWNFNEYDSLAIQQNVGKNFLTALRHTIQPRIYYNFVPRENQEKNPFYVLEDRIVSKNELTYSITNILTKKTSHVSLSHDKGNTKPTLTTSFDNLLYWQLATGYDFEEKRRKQYLEKYPRRPIKNLYSEFEIYALSWLTYTGKTFFSLYTGNVTRHDHTISLSSAPFTWKTGLSFREPYYNYREKLRYRDENNLIISSRLRLLQNSFTIQPFHFLKITFDDFRNMRESGNFGKTNSQFLEVAYLAQCYHLIGRYRYDGYDRSYTLLVEIPGIFD